MSDSEKTPPDSSAVEDALDKIPGLADQVGSGSKPESEKESDDAASDETAEEQQPQGVAPEEREPAEDSEAVQAALNEIPGLKDRTEG